MTALNVVYFIAAFAAIMSLGCVLALWQLRQAYARLSKVVIGHQRQMQALQADIKTATAGAVGMGRRLMALEGKLQELAEAQEQTVDHADHYAYTQAKHMFDQGADVQTVVSNCGLSSSEAQLMALVRAQLGSAAAGGKPGTR